MHQLVVADPRLIGRLIIYNSLMIFECATTHYLLFALVGCSSFCNVTFSLFVRVCEYIYIYIFTRFRVGFNGAMLSGYNLFHVTMDNTQPVMSTFQEHNC